jgi:hypothetical protein
VAGCQENDCILRYDDGNLMMTTAEDVWQNLNQDEEENPAARLAAFQM